MGECTYYFKAQFKTAAQAKKAYPKIQKFLKEAKKAYDFWQSNRDKAQDQFWVPFQIKFPTVCTYLKIAYAKDESVLDNNNGLSGKLDFGQQEECIENMAIFDSVIGYEAYDVWHFMDWSGLIPFFKQQFGATKVVVANEEDGTGSLDSLQLYEYQEIVEALVKREALAGPSLRGIHPDLDEMLDLSFPVKRIASKPSATK